MCKLSVFISLMVLVNLSWADDITTNSPIQQTSDVEVNSTPDAGQEIPEETTTNSAIEPQTTTAQPAPVCSKPGVFAHNSNCRLYHECTSAGSEDGGLQLSTKSCPEREAFNSVAKRCGRDISSCQPKISCVSKGVIADPESNTSYYLCQPCFDGSNFYLFHINCGPKEVYAPALGTCLNELGVPSYNAPNDDINIVKNELKQLKQDYKLAIKEAKKQKKEEDKLRKSQEELKKKARKEEAAAFICETEGNFPSQLADNQYIACVNKKSKLIAFPIECSLDGKFNPQSGLCVRGGSNEGSGNENQ